MEFQGRGVIHYHVFIERQCLAERGWLDSSHMVSSTRQRRLTTIIRGPLDTRLYLAWVAAVGDRSPEFLAFQRGGIVELLRTPDAAARYIAKEAGKRAQKRLPEGVKACGRWWYLSPAGKPVVERMLTMPCHVLTHLPWKRIFEKHLLFANRPGGSGRSRQDYTARNENR